MDEEESPPVGDDKKVFLQKVLGSVLYYARAVDMTIIHVLNEITEDQVRPT